MLCPNGSSATLQALKYHTIIYLLNIECVMNKLAELQYNAVALQWNQAAAYPQKLCNVLHFNITMCTNTMYYIE